MEEDTLKDKLWNKINVPLMSVKNYDVLLKATNECEKICIQSQIDLLKEMYDYAYKIMVAESAGYFLLRNDISERIRSLTNKLNSLK